MRVVYKLLYGLSFYVSEVVLSICLGVVLIRWNVCLGCGMGRLNWSLPTPVLVVSLEIPIQLLAFWSGLIRIKRFLFGSWGWDWGKCIEMAVVQGARTGSGMVSIWEGSDGVMPIVWPINRYFPLGLPGPSVKTDYIQ